jgi:hypothetical protein
MIKDELNSVPADKFVRRVSAYSTALLFVSALVLRTHKGDLASISSSLTHLIAFSIATFLMWLAAGYCGYLVWQSVRDRLFPSPRSKLPVRSRIYEGAVAAMFRCVMFLAGACLLVLPMILVMRMI